MFLDHFLREFLYLGILRLLRGELSQLDFFPVPQGQHRGDLLINSLASLSLAAALGLAAGLGLCARLDLHTRLARRLIALLNALLLSARRCAFPLLRGAVAVLLFGLLFLGVHRAGRRGTAVRQRDGAAGLRVHPRAHAVAPAT